MPIQEGVFFFNYQEVYLTDNFEIEFRKAMEE